MGFDGRFDIMAGISPGLAGQINNNIQTDGLVLYLDAAYKKSYPRTGTTWYDLSGNGNNGTLSAAAIGTVSSSLDTMAFNGTDEYVEFSSIQPANATIIWWTTVYVASATSYLGNYPRGTPGSDGATWYSYANESYWNVYGRRTDVGSIAITDDTGATLVANTWYQVCGRYDGSTMKIYVNGDEKKSNSFAGLQYTATNKFYIGAIDNDASAGPNLWYNGNISIFQIYDRALSAAEVKQNYDAQKERFGF